MNAITPGASAPIVAVFQTATEIRVIIRDGDPWFVAGDVAGALDYSHTPHMLRVLDDDEKGVHIVDTHGGIQELTIISESGLYAAILKSRKPEAKKFKKWITSEVLPSIRKTGSYVVKTTRPDQALTSSDQRNLQRLVRLISNRFNYDGAAAFAVWKLLRLAAGCPAPQPFEVRHLPLIGAEFRRIYPIVNAYQLAVYNSEATIIKSLAGDVTELAARLEHEFMAAATATPASHDKATENFMQAEIARLINRQPNHSDMDDAIAENKLGVTP